MTGRALVVQADLAQEVGIIAGFRYGSSLFHPPRRCHDIDLVVVTKTHAGLWFMRLPGQPSWSVTLTDQPTLEGDLERLAVAGFLVNKLLNPIRPFGNVAMVRAWQRRAVGAVGMPVVAWKHEQFPGWNRTHRSPWRPPEPQGLVLDGLRASPEDRGHWQVYRSLARGQS